MEQDFDDLHSFNLLIYHVFLKFIVVFQKRPTGLPLAPLMGPLSDFS